MKMTSAVTVEIRRINAHASGIIMSNYLIEGEGPTNLLSKGELNTIFLHISRIDGVVKCKTMNLRNHSLKKDLVIFTAEVDISDTTPTPITILDIKNKLETFAAIKNITLMTLINTL